MSVTGGIKFFKEAKNLFRDETTIVGSTNDDAAKYVLDFNKFTKWESLGSNDSTQETLEITFNESKTIDRLFILNHNLKDSNIKYWTGSAYADFSSVIGVNGVTSSTITETAYARATSYYEFASVTTTKIKIFMNKTQVADEDKEINSLYVTEEIGTFEGYPRISKILHSRNIREAKALSGKRIIQKSYESVNFNINFRVYPLQADIDIVIELHELEDSFMVWLCGGRTGTTFFRFENRGYRLEDLFNMQINKPLSTDYNRGIYVNGVDMRMSLVEVI